MFTSLLAVAFGLTLLVLAADRLVVAAVRVSQVLGISTILIGALIVGLGTSIPELLVSAIAGAEDKVDVAMANVVGSNIANVTLVLGAAALVAPVRARLRTLRREGTLMLLAVVGLAVVLSDQEVEVWEGAVLLAGMLFALYFLVHWSVADADGGFTIERQALDDVDGRQRPIMVDILWGLGALVLTVFSAKLLVDGALDIGVELGLSDSFLGIMLGVGTSLPEVATALASIRRKQSDLVIGNVLGSNLFNSLGVAGTAAIVGPGSLEDLGATSVWIMIGAAFLAGLMAKTGHQIGRREGVVLLVVFLAFTILAY